MKNYQQDFRWVFLPYALKKLDDGSYDVLNRSRQSLGKAFDAKIQGIDKALLKRLSWDGKGKPSPDGLYVLYNNAASPLVSISDWLIYCEKLATLAPLMVRHTNPHVVHDLEEI